MVPSQPVKSQGSGLDVAEPQHDFDNPMCSVKSDLSESQFASPLAHNQQQQQPRYRHSTTGKPKLGTYEIDKTIGKGIFSVVKSATHTITGIKLAIKLIDKTRLDAENLIKIYRESDILKKLHHPNIVKLFQIMETPRLLCLVMEYLPNGEVFDYIASHGRFPEDQARVKFLDVLCAVDYTHSCGIVHRDLKAENLLFDSDMNIKLIDFSFGTHHSESALLTTWCGSPPYAAPEIFNGEPYVGTKADIWSLGVVLYVMVCGTLPFDAQPLPHLKKQVLSASFRVPYWLSLTCERLIRAMLAKVPAKRPSARELFQHPWFTESSTVQSQTQLSSGDVTGESLTASSTIPIPIAKNLSETRIQPAASESVREFTTNVPDLAKRRAVMEPGSDLAADAAAGKVNEFVILLMESYGMKRSQILESLNRRAYDHLMATYLLLGEKVRRHRYSLQLPLTPDRHLITSSVPMWSKPRDAFANRSLFAKQSRVDSAVDMKSVISESDSSTASFSIPSENNAAFHQLSITDPSTQQRFSLDEPQVLEPTLVPNLSTHLPPTSVWSTSASGTSQPVTPFLYDAQFYQSVEDSLVGSFEPSQKITFSAEDSTNRPWLISGQYMFGNDEQVGNGRPRRNLVRRKYGVFDPPAQLAQLAQSVLAERYDVDVPSERDSCFTDDG